MTNSTMDHISLWKRRALAAEAKLSALAEPVPPAGEPVPDYFVAACDKFDWTPEEALRFYAEGKHFDIVDGRTRILCTGAIASHALKGLSADYADMKGVDPVPPAGGEPEVVAWRSSDAFGAVYAYEPDRPADEYHGLVTLENHRAHITRLKAELKGIKEGMAYRGSLFGKVQAERDDLKSEVERLQALSVTNIMLDVIPGDGDGFEVYAKYVTDVEKALTQCYNEIDQLQDKLNSSNADKEAYAQNAIDLRERVDALQAELTKARELLEFVVNSGGFSYVTIWKDIRTFLAHQSAPAAKVLGFKIVEDTSLAPDYFKCMKGE
ncbi:hypothetical protein [Pseudomonas sp. NFACC05-1]|uniref:hypothetical protein n=1 Tax=Pseudomonas sp. NFACC05-1 TaxID=1566241 RepID=UPI0008712F7E|nr:hypothetical protein [Pseudomonas sp. NFACC05-1]SCW91981.1 hypothetical protein SAMN03159424_04407 [Pseudomonas sp. NFACC05-1]